MYKAFLLGFLFCSAPLFAQVYEYGQVPLEHLEMTIYDKDSSASAVVLFDVGEGEVIYKDWSFQSTFKVHTRIKILTDEAINLADIVIGYTEKYPEQKVKNIKASSYWLSEDGRKMQREIGRRDRFTDEVSDFYSEIKFLIPEVRKGSIIEYSYEIESQYAFDFNTWFFQREIPVMESRFSIKIPSYFRFFEDLRGYLPLSYREQFRYEDRITSGYTAMGYYGYTYMFGMRDIPALEEEPYMRPNIDYLSYVALYLTWVDFPGGYRGPITESWSSVIEELSVLEGLAEDMGISEELKSFSDSVLVGIEGQFATMLSLYEAVRDSFKMDLSLDDLNIPASNEVFERKANEVIRSTALIQLLRDQNIEAHPFLTSNRENGQIIPNYPNSDQFDRFMVYARLDSSYYILDPIEDLLPYNVYSPSILGNRGLVIDTTFTLWLNLENTRRNNQLKTVSVDLNSEGFTAELKAQSFGLLAYEERTSIDREEFQNSYNELHFQTSTVKLDTAYITNDDISDSFEYTLEVSGPVTASEDLLYFNPMFMGRLEENPFKLDDRTFPVDYDFPFDENIVMTISIPEGWAIEELPQPVLLRLPDRDAEFRRIVQEQDGSLMMNYRFRINKMRFMPDEYEYLKAFYDQMVISLSENIVLTKTD